jgi:hypothetical protein
MCSPLIPSALRKNDLKYCNFFERRCVLLSNKQTMKKIFSLAFLISAFQGLAQETKERAVEPFTKIEVMGASKVYYTHSDTLRLKVSGPESETENLETKVENGTLIIHTKGKNEGAVTVYVSHNNLSDIRCGEASTFKSTNLIKTETLSLGVSGAANVNVKAEAKSVVVEESGASNLNLSGTTDNLDAQIAGASTLKSYDLISKNANIKAAGASSAKVYVTTRLVAKAGGASSVKVKGEVKDIDADISSAASVTRILEKGESQVNEKGDSTTFKWKGKKIIVVEGKKEYNASYHPTRNFDHWAGLSLGVNGLLTPDASTTMEKSNKFMDLNYSRCINVQLNPFQHNFHIYKNHINLVTGFGVEWRRYMFENKTNLDPDSSYTWGSIDSGNTYKYSKNVLRSTMLQVPLLLDFNSSRKAGKSFHLAVGVIGQFMIGARTKQALESGGYEFTKIYRDTYNMSPISLKAHASLGYSDFSMFAEYNITQLFDKGEGPQLYPFVVGVRVIPF